MNFWKKWKKAGSLCMICTVLFLCAGNGYLAAGSEMHRMAGTLKSTGADNESVTTESEIQPEENAQTESETQSEENVQTESEMQPEENAQTESDMQPEENAQTES